MTGQVKDAKTAVESLLDYAGVKRIVYVDDLFRIPKEADELIGSLVKIDKEKRPHIDGVDYDLDPDIWKQQLRDTWAELHHEQLNDLAQEVDAVLQTVAKRDLEYAGTLKKILADLPLELMSLMEWNKSKQEVFESAQDQPVLLLFDQDFTREGGTAEQGIGLIQEALGSMHSHNLYCGLLSITYAEDEEQNEWKRLVASTRLDEDRFILTSKNSLEKPIHFAHALKRTILSPVCKGMKSEVAKILDTAHENSKQQIENMSIYDFEHAVFVTSLKEGVWEPDAIFRIYGLFHRDVAKKEARGNSALQHIIDKIRKISAVKTLEVAGDSEHFRRIQHLEYYIEGVFINRHNMPIELGDVFERTSTETKARFVLLAQPCDLMVRSSPNKGRRVRFTHDAYCVKLQDSKPKANPGEPPGVSFYELPHIRLDDTENWYANFRQTHLVRLCILDLCAFNKDGRAYLKVADECDKCVIPSWQARYKILVKLFSKVIKNKKSIKDKGLGDEYAKLAEPSSTATKLFKSEVDANDGTVEYGCRRILRITQPLAGAMLARFSQYMSRAAFKHDLTRLPRKEK